MYREDKGISAVQVKVVHLVGVVCHWFKEKLDIDLLYGGMKSRVLERSVKKHLMKPESDWLKGSAYQVSIVMGLR